MHIKRSVLNNMDHVGHSRGSNSWVILVDHFCGSNLWVILVGHSRGPNSGNTVAIATTLGDYDGGTELHNHIHHIKINSSYFRC